MSLSHALSQHPVIRTMNFLSRARPAPSSTRACPAHSRVTLRVPASVPQTWVPATRRAQDSIVNLLCGLTCARSHCDKRERRFIADSKLSTLCLKLEIKYRYIIFSNRCLVLLFALNAVAIIRKVTWLSHSLSPRRSNVSLKQILHRCRCVVITYFMSYETNTDTFINKVNLLFALSVSTNLALSNLPTNALAGFFDSESSGHCVSGVFWSCCFSWNHLWYLRSS